jgi:tetratricopeptide (TPR) repeat protein
MLPAATPSASCAARNRGNDHLRAGLLDEAASAYAEALAAASWREGGALTQLPAADRADATAALLNRAQVRLKQGRPADAVRDCACVLAADPGNEKALFRRASALETLGEMRPAMEDAVRLLQVNRGSVEGTALLRRLRSASTAGGAGRPAAAAAARARMTVEEAVSCLRGGAPPASAEGSAGSGKNSGQGG